MATSPNTPATPQLGVLGNRVTIAAIALASLYFGREVLIPLVLAIMLALLVAPLVRAMRRFGVGRTSSVLVTVLGLTVLLGAAAAALGIHVLRMANSLPQYQENVQRKLVTLDEMTVGRLRLFTTEASRFIAIPDMPDEVPDSAGSREQRASPRPKTPAARQALESTPRTFGAMRLLKSFWKPLQTAGIVLVVFVFVLFEYESLRDRFIGLAGATDIRATTLALNDAGERLSRYFVSQFAVNFAFAGAIWLVLSILRVPDAMLLGAVAGVLRFVPYVGVGIAAICATALAFAVDPGWSLAACTLGVFILLDVLVGQLLEPHLYGHGAGLSPLSIVIGTIFWSSLWGPIGLILSTPLTLCLVVAGRHMKSLGALELLLSDARVLTLPQRFYQRALSGDSQEILADARVFLSRDSLAAYCDRVLIPALHLAHLDTDPGPKGQDHLSRIRRVIVDVVAALYRRGLKIPRRLHRGSVLQAVDPGRWLRQQREQVIGRWQGPLGVPPGSVVICTGLSSPADDLVAELLVQLLRIQKVDARHFSPADVQRGLPQGADPEGVSIVYLVSAFPGPVRSGGASISQKYRALLPLSSLVAVFCPGVSMLADPGEGAGYCDETASSLEQAVQICNAWQAAHRTS